ncbi:MAG: hypothetical protein RSJ41_02665 [Clostridia bacterium]
MYKIVKNNVTVACVEQPYYIRKSSTSDAYIPCSEAEAQGVACDGVQYHIWGKPEMTGTTAESVALVEFNGGAMILDQQRIIDALLGSATGAGGKANV